MSSLSRSDAKSSIIEPDEHICPGCGNGYKSLTNHWHQSSVCDHYDAPSALLDMLRACNVFGGGFHLDKKYPRFHIENMREPRFRLFRALSGIFGRDIVSRSRLGVWKDDLREYEGNVFSTIPHYEFTEDSLDPNNVNNSSLFVKTALFLYGNPNNMGHNGEVTYISLSVPAGLSDTFESYLNTEFYTFDEGSRVRYHFRNSDLIHYESVKFPVSWWNHQFVNGDIQNTPILSEFNGILIGEVAPSEATIWPRSDE